MKDALDPGTRDWGELFEETVNSHPKGKQLDSMGREILDPRPMAPPVAFQRGPSMVEHIRNLVRSELLAQAASDADVDTFDEADDFDVGDDFEPGTPYEAVFDPPPPPPPEPSQGRPEGAAERPEGLDEAEGGNNRSAAGSADGNSGNSAST